MIGVGIIGCGGVGRKRMEQLPAHSELRALCDISDKAVISLHRDHEQKILLTSNATRVFDDPDIQLVIIATPNNVLAPLALAALEAGKHVLIEKPGALNANELWQVSSKAIATNLVAHVGYNLRFHPAINQVREWMGSREIFMIRGFYGHGARPGYESEWRMQRHISGGGVLMDMGVHLIDLAKMFFDDLMLRHAALTTAFWESSVEDNAVLHLATERANIYLHASCTEWKNQFSLEVYGYKAKAAVTGLGGSYGPERCAIYRMGEQMGPPDGETREYLSPDRSWHAELEFVLRQITTNQPNYNNINTAVRTLELVGSAYR